MTEKQMSKATGGMFWLFILGLGVVAAGSGVAGGYIYTASKSNK